MSLNASLAHALTGLTFASRRAELVSGNIANALTEGYARRDLVAGGRPGGSVQRIVDRGLLSDRRLADASLARDSRLAAGWQRVERTAAGSGEGDDLASRIARLEAALTSAAGDPASELRLGDVLARLGDVTSSLNRQAGEIQAQRTEADARIADEVSALNAALRQVERLNGEIGRTQDGSTRQADLMDARQRALDEISAIVPIRVFDRADGAVAITARSGTVLLEGRAAEVGFAPGGVVTADKTYANGLLSGLEVDGRAISPDDGYSRLGGGSLGAAFAMRDEHLAGASDQLDEIAADLISRFEDAGIDPSLLPGNPGLLTDNGAALNPADITGLAGRIAVNAAVDPARGGELWRIRDGVDAAAPGPVGESAQIERWLTGLSRGQTLTSGGAPLGAAGHAAGWLSSVGNARAAADEAMSFSSARQATLQQAEFANGVDTDAEMQTLLLVEQSYAANARVMQTIDGLMQTLLEI